MSSDLQGTYLTHNAKRNGGTLDIWHVDDERQQLVVMSGMEKTVRDSGHYVHTPAKAGIVPNCPYHPLCTRESMATFRAE